MSKQNRVLGSTIQDIFQNQGMKQLAGRAKNKKKIGQRADLELALTVLLVDLASCDQNFDQQEYQVIVSGLNRMFGTQRHEIQKLVNQANIALANLRGVSRFADLLKEQLDQDQKKQIMDIIDEIINVDGEIDGFETYLHHKLAKMLGMQEELEQKKAAEG